jgi:D-lactate dehydrogenase (cytochrome)
VRTGGRARKSAAGYDLTRLLVGSEGTLGVITEVALRLHGLPEAMSAAVCAFPAVEAAVDTVILVVQSGIPVARIELLDELQMRACMAHARIEGYDPAPTLFLEFHGSETGVAEQARQVEAIAREHGGAGFRWATRPEDRSRLWQARHDAYYAALALRSGARSYVTDVCVPISRLAECIRETRADLEAERLLAPIVGHVGDGNFHTQILFDPDDADERARVEAVAKRMVRRALAMGGTCSGEHGIGLGKIDSLALEHGEALGVMAAIKRALDPRGLMNPGKILRLMDG